MFVINNSKKVASLFGDWKETMIWSCLQGVMGSLYVVEEEPKSALAIVGDFCCLAGEPESRLLQKPSKDTPSQMVMVPQNEIWGRLIEETFGDKAKRITRYALKKEADFDEEGLQKYVDGLSAEYKLSLIDERRYEECLQSSWSKDFVSNFADYAMFDSLALGVVALFEDRIVAGASAYSAYRGGIEIQIQTDEEYQRRGLAYACGAKLILSCLERNLFPSWDAKTQISLELAEKLGYRFSHEYVAYDIEW